MKKEELVTLAEYIYKEAFDANCYYSVIRQYDKNREDNFDLISISPAFYHVVYNSLVISTVMELSKIYDKGSDSVNIRTLLTAFKENISLFPVNRGSFETDVDGEIHRQDISYQHVIKKEEECFFKDEVEKNRVVTDLFGFKDGPVRINLTIEEYLELYQKKYRSIQPKINNLIAQRNKIYAHNDKMAIEDMQVLIKKNLLKKFDVQELINYALEISKFIIACLTGINKCDEPVNIDDWQVTLSYAKLGIKYSKLELVKQLEEI